MSSRHIVHCNFMITPFVNLFLVNTTILWLLRIFLVNTTILWLLLLNPFFLSYIECMKIAMYNHQKIIIQFIAKSSIFHCTSFILYNIIILFFIVTGKTYKQKKINNYYVPKMCHAYAYSRVIHPVTIIFLLLIYFFLSLLEHLQWRILD